MFALIRKEIINIYNWTFILFIVLFSFLMVLNKKNDIINLVLPLTFLAAFKNIENDNKVNMDVILNSLPVSRLQIVVVKFISFHLYFLMAFLLCGWLMKITNYFSPIRTSAQMDFSISIFLIAYIIWGFYMTVYIPISFLFKSQIVQYVCGLIFVFLAPLFLHGVLSKNPTITSWLMQFDLPYLIVISVGIVILNVISCLILYGIYRKRDLL